MTIFIDLPDDIATRLESAWDSLPRAVLEAVETYLAYDEHDLARDLRGLRRLT